MTFLDKQNFSRFDIRWWNFPPTKDKKKYKFAMLTKITVYVDDENIQIFSYDFIPHKTHHSVTFFHRGKIKSRKILLLQKKKIHICYTRWLKENCSLHGCRRRRRVAARFYDNFCSHEMRDSTTLRKDESTMWSVFIIAWDELKFVRQESKFSILFL